MKQKEENIQGTEKEFIDLFKELTTSRSDWQDPVPISGAGLFDVKQQLDLLQTDENLADLRDCEFSNCFQWRHNDDQ